MPSLGAECFRTDRGLGTLFWSTSEDLHRNLDRPRRPCFMLFRNMLCQEVSSLLRFFKAGTFEAKSL